MLKVTGALLVVAAIVLSSMLIAAPAEAAGAPPGPEQLGYHQMTVPSTSQASGSATGTS